jgi:hypothetical protein
MPYICSYDAGVGNLERETTFSWDFFGEAEGEEALSWWSTIRLKVLR